MNISNINDLSKLLSEKQKKYTFRMLEKKDVEAAVRLMVIGFAHHNPVLEIIQGEEKDVESWFSATDFDKIVNQNLSFGAFYEGKLVSATLAHDNELDIYVQGVNLTKKAEKTQECQDILVNDYLNSRKFEEGELVYLCLLGTNPEHFRENLAALCTYLTALESQKRRFQSLIVDSWHVGTYGSIKKVFIKSEVVKELIEFEGKPADLKTAVCSFYQT